MTRFTTNHLQYMANAVRKLSYDMVYAANSGHPGAPLGMADIATTIFAKHLNFNPKNPSWAGRDRFVLSNGHASAMLYSLLYLTGYDDINLEDLKHFRKLGSKTAGHPENFKIAGIETTTGPLGQGLANAVGMAYAEKLLQKQYGKIFDNHTFVMCGDGCLMEGISEEAISFAGHNKLNKLILFWDNNKITIDGSTDMSTSTDMPARFKANRWNVIEVDGHNFSQIDKAITKAKKSSKPTMISCKTIIGKGSVLQGSEKTHGSPLKEDDIMQLNARLGFSDDAFSLPMDVQDLWIQAGQKSVAKYEAWIDLYKKEKNPTVKLLIEKDFEKQNKKLSEKVATLKKKYADISDKIATRQAFQNVMNDISKYIPTAIGGSSDLTPSNNTFVNSLPYIHYGIREHFMGACMNGLNLYAGLKSYGGTFLTFFDYMKPAVRLSALMKNPVVYVYSHDSIALGEDGPTHQPVEHLTALRSIPNLNTFRPADSIEMAECLELAFSSKDTPSAIITSRQGLPNVRKSKSGATNLCKKGAYILCDKGVAKGTEPNITLLACGSEIELILQAKELLKDSKKSVRIVSVPCLELFNQQTDAYKLSVLGSEKTKVIAVEMATGYEWQEYADEVICLNQFGKSGKGSDVVKYFDFTPKAVTKVALDI